MEISGSQYQFVKFLSSLTTGQSREVVTSAVQLVADLTGSVIDPVLTASGSTLLSNDLWTFSTYNPSGSIWNTKMAPKNVSSEAVAAVVMLSEGLSTGSF